MARIPTEAIGIKRLESSAPAEAKPFCNDADLPPRPRIIRTPQEFVWALNLVNLIRTDVHRHPVLMSRVRDLAVPRPHGLGLFLVGARGVHDHDRLSGFSQERQEFYRFRTKQRVQIP